ncbi:MAG: chemotaxis protein CheX, partial [Fibrobacteres bacterium]|nr:chemotaxis protein CheX [Fibrobacterota bacterium]
MDNTIIRNTLIESCVEVFEKMLFVEIKDSTHDTADTFKHELAGKIRFEGAYTGKLEMECSMSLAKELTVSFLGIDESEITSDKIFDNLKELVNMICGNMFCKLDEEKS